MSNGNKQEAQAQSEGYARGFRTGAMIGCAPLLMMIGFAMFLAVVSSYRVSPRDGESDTALVLPVIPDVDEEYALSLLPRAGAAEYAPVYLGEDLSQVPLLSLDRIEQAPSEEWKKRKAQAVALAMHFDNKDEDGYVKALLRTRPDLSGLPFAMGGACRTEGDDALAFKDAASAVRSKNGGALLSEPNAGTRYSRTQHDLAHMAVVSQVVPAEESQRDRQSLIRGLASIARPEATRRLAQLAVFSPDQFDRDAALEALEIRHGEPATSVLLAGLNYPWPPVARNAATAIARLKRTDLIPQLEAVLEAPDPRAPQLEDVAGQQETVTYELVRVNHLQNCLLCHAPIRRGASKDILSAEIPVPSVRLPSAYYDPESNLLVRIDVTYLRQDFSAQQEVEDWTARDWPKRQRFDFLLRRRILGPEEAEDLRQRLAAPSPYRRAAAVALQALTGKPIALD